MFQNVFQLAVLFFLGDLVAADIGGTILQRNNQNIPCVGTDVVGYQMVSPSFCVSDLTGDQVWHSPFASNACLESM